jgi:VWFA-related protein
MSRSTRAGLAGLLVWLGTGPVTGQPSPPSYATHAAAVTVDVVVLDGHGAPVRGLTKEDFTVLEDGRPQPIVGFEARESSGAGAGPEVAAGAEDIGATNTGPSAGPGRVLALLIDDLGISAPVASQLRPALATWIGARAQPRDEITLMTTSGSIWWSALVATGRDDLLTVLGRVQGRMLTEGAGGEQMSDAEAYRIDVVEQSMEYAVGSNAARSRPVDALPAPGGSVSFVGNATIERVAQRWLDSRVCPPCSSPYESGVDCREIRQCLQRVRLRATELHNTSLRRSATLLQALARLSTGLAAAEGRKSVLVVSEALVNDASLGGALRDAVDAAQRANTSVYFLDARGIAGTSFLEAAGASQPPRGQDLGAIHAEESVLATGGGESLADETGGTLTRSNDLSAGLERMASDSSAYYLLGYQPEKPPDGNWHTLAVKVARSGVQVRARRGYRALRPEDLPRAEAPKPPAEQAAKAGDVHATKGGKPAKETLVSKRPLDPTLLAGSTRGKLPLRVAAYVADTNGAGAARVVVVLEIDNGRVTVSRTTSPWRATLDLSIVTAGLFHAPAIPVDERLQLTLGPGDVGNGWWLVRRELWLPAGVSQIRVLVRDTVSGAAGLVTQRVEVPDIDRPYLSTPMFSDRTLPPLRPGEPPRLVPTARRVFGERETLYCQFEVFGFGGFNLAGVPQLFAGYTLERPDGSVVSQEPPKLIDTDGYRAVRRLALPLAGLEAGTYVLNLAIQDRLAGRTLTSRASFEVIQK